jgi:hypothetical protein
MSYGEKSQQKQDPFAGNDYMKDIHDPVERHIDQ